MLRKARAHRNPRLRHERLDLDRQRRQNYLHHQTEGGTSTMRLKTGTIQTFRLGLAAIGALAFSTALAFGNLSQARAQDDASADTASAPAADQPDQSANQTAEGKAKGDAG